MDFDKRMDKTIGDFVKKLADDLGLDYEEEKRIEYELHELDDEDLGYCYELQTKKDDILHRFEIKKKEMEHKLEKEMKAEYLTYSKHHKKLWDYFYKKYDLDPNQHYTLTEDHIKQVIKTKSE